MADVSVKMAGLEAAALFLHVLLTNMALDAHRYARVKRIIQKDVTPGLEFVSVRQVGLGKHAPEHVRFTSMERSVPKAASVKMGHFAIQLMDPAYVLQGTTGSNVENTAHKTGMARTVNWSVAAKTLLAVHMNLASAYVDRVGRVSSVPSLAHWTSMEVTVPRYVIVRTMDHVIQYLASVHVAQDILGTNVRRLVIKATMAWPVLISVPALAQMLKAVIQNLADVYANLVLEV